MEPIKVKVFANTSNPLPEESTPFSAAKDIRAELGLLPEKFLVKATACYVPATIETGFLPVDLAITPNQTDENIVKAVIVHPNGRFLSPSGLFMEIPNGYSMDVRPRSGLSLKYGIDVLNSPGLIDPDYRGDVGVYS